MVVKKHIINGVTKTFESFEAAIFLEDDLIVSEKFLSHMYRGLHYYKKHKRVFHLSGFSFLENNKNTNSYFSRYMNCWGWATWKDRWVYFDQNIKSVRRSFTKDEIYLFNIENSNDFFRQIVENDIGILDTWAIFWYAAIFKNGGLCLVPPKTLVKNLGNDGSGERHGRLMKQFDISEIASSKFPDLIVEDQEMLVKLKLYFKNQTNFFVKVGKKIIYLLPPMIQRSLLPTLLILARKLKI